MIKSENNRQTQIKSKEAKKKQTTLKISPPKEQIEDKYDNNEKYEKEKARQIIEGTQRDKCKKYEKKQK